MQTIQNNGRPAFPVTEQNGANSGDCGMDLRDYFAAHAPIDMADVRNEWHRRMGNNKQPSLTQLFTIMAEMRSDYANTMLAARANEQPVPREAYDQCNADLVKAEAKLEELGCCRCLNGDWVAPAAEVQS
jgi:hypothetical protein